ncbi:MAG: radical SAM protein [Candidatus Rokubacteria bacterium]|nr:radical SAM protein [Candidatus Rokubacteria bacterium]
MRGVLGAARAAWDYYREPDVVTGSPLFLQVEPTILCNLECAFCINPFLPRTRTSLTLAKFQQLLDQAPSVAKISLVGIGESTMNKELWAIVRHAKSRGIEIGTTSNGTILTDRIFNEIFDSGLDFLNFSLDGATKGTYEKMRPGAVFEDVLANIERVVTEARRRGRPPIAIWFLSTSQNIGELPMMVDLVKELGVTRLCTQGVHYWGHEDWHGRAREANSIPELRQTLREVAARARANGIAFQALNFPDVTAERGCKWPWKGSYITADGFVTPCCENGSDPDKINFGNVFQTPYAEIWNSPAYQQFRRDLRDPASRPPICVDCPSYHRTLTI